MTIPLISSGNLIEIMYKFTIHIKKNVDRSFLSTYTEVVLILSDKLAVINQSCTYIICGHPVDYTSLEN